MAIPQNVDQITAGLRPAPVDFYRTSQVAKAAGAYVDFMVGAGFPAGLAVPPLLAGAQCNGATQGAIQIGSTPGGKDSWLTGISGVSSVSGGLILYDRLAHWGGAVGNVTTLQSLGAIALPRYTDFIGVVPFLVFYSATGSTASNCTVTYQNELGTVRSVVVAMPTTPAVGQLVPIPLLGGDKGVRGTGLSLQLNVSSGTPGNFGIVLVKRFPCIGAVANIGFNLDWLDLGMPKIEDNACLSLMGIASATNTGFLDLKLNFSDV